MVVEEYPKALKTGVSVEQLQLTTRGRLEAAVGVLSVVAVVLLAVRDAGRDEATAARPAAGLVPASGGGRRWRRGGTGRRGRAGRWGSSWGRWGGWEGTRTAPATGRRGG
jgi:hypothetical protein